MNSTRNDEQIEDIPQQISKSSLEKWKKANIQRNDVEITKRLNSRLQYQTERIRTRMIQPMENDRYLLKRDASLN